jgi:hypothetical protein
MLSNDHQLAGITEFKLLGVTTWNEHFPAKSKEKMTRVLAVGSFSKLPGAHLFSFCGQRRGIIYSNL